VDAKDDQAFGQFLAKRALALSSPMGTAATLFTERVLDLVADAVATGDLRNTLQGDLELARANFLDECIRLFESVEEG
jgi:hypothetical protein